MAERGREAWITGIGILSSLGEGPDAHWRRLMEGRPVADDKAIAPYVVHPLAPVDFDKQIPKKGDQRQMEPLQRIGTYAAGLALESAGIKGKPDLLAKTDMIVAAGGGERDLAVDAAILTNLPKAEDPQAFLNERLMNDLRPTLFLAQLSNLLAGNISIVHGVTGSSRTFMGEEAAGVDAVRIALARIRAGQSEIALVGGAHNGERKDLLAQYEFGGYLLKGAYKPVWERAPAGGFAAASLGAFLVVEARDHAQARGAKPLARLTAALSDRSHREPGAVTASLRRLWEKIAPALEEGRYAVFSGASGAEPATAEERAFLTELSGVAVRAPGSYVGHGPEPQFPMNVALAALAIAHGGLFAPCDRTGLEKGMDATLTQVVVTGVGHWRGEGLALVEAVRA
ncbi:MAG TPA: beta-ketoacyl-ACP synthase [Xanthobacteraceae bacterium]|nr:beta-ketoacyl-ACP synthase [Xanthobacteraceae bacterium]